MVKVRGQNSNGKTVKQTVKNGRKISGDDAARPAWVMVPGVSSSRLRPDSDQSRIWCRARPWLGCDSLNELTWVGFVVHWHLSDNFFLYFFVVSWVLFDKTVTEYRVWRKVHGTAEEVRCYPQRFKRPFRYHPHGYDWDRVRHSRMLCWPIGQLMMTQSVETSCQKSYFVINKASSSVLLCLSYPQTPGW